MFPMKTHRRNENEIPVVFCESSVPFLRTTLLMTETTQLPDEHFMREAIKQAVKQALEGIVGEGMLSEADAQQAAGWILAGNAREFYRLG